MRRHSSPRLSSLCALRKLIPFAGQDSQPAPSSASKPKGGKGKGPGKGKGKGKKKEEKKEEKKEKDGKDKEKKKEKKQKKEKETTEEVSRHMEDQLKDWSFEASRLRFSRLLSAVKRSF